MEYRLLELGNIVRIAECNEYNRQIMGRIYNNIIRQSELGTLTTLVKVE